MPKPHAQPPPHSRREFLSWAGGTTLLAAAGAPLAPATAEAHPRALDGAWDMSWTERVNGKYRAVFDSPSVSDGDALFRAMMWCDQYKEVYGTARSEMCPVLVFRHQGIRLALIDAYWKRFEIGKEIKLKTPAGKKWAEANPILSVPPDTPPKFANYTLQQFLSDGGIVLACGLAFEMVVENFKNGDKLDDSTARVRAHAALVPGVILQPSGVFAVLRAQEAGCRFFLGS